MSAIMSREQVLSSWGFSEKDLSKWQPLVPSKTFELFFLILKEKANEASQALSRGRFIIQGEWTQEQVLSKLTTVFVEKLMLPSEQTQQELTPVSKEGDDYVILDSAEQMTEKQEESDDDLVVVGKSEGES